MRSEPPPNRDSPSDTEFLLKRGVARISIVHSTEYSYRNAVGLTRHRLMLRPDDSHDLRLHNAALDLKIIVENKIAIAAHAVPRPQQESAGIEVDGIPVILFRRSPAKTDMHLVQSGIDLVKVDFVAAQHAE